MIEQIGIAICGLTACYLSQDPREKWARWACIFGLCGEPFWFWAVWKAEQWGILVMVFFYTFCWARGIKTYWMKK